jgi:hypothetical protein
MKSLCSVSNVFINEFQSLQKFMLAGLEDVDEESGGDISQTVGAKDDFDCFHDSPG